MGDNAVGGGAGQVQTNAAQLQGAMSNITQLDMNPQQLATLNKILGQLTPAQLSPLTMQTVAGLIPQIMQTSSQQMGQFLFGDQSQVTSALNLFQSPQYGNVLNTLSSLPANQLKELGNLLSSLPPGTLQKLTPQQLVQFIKNEAPDIAQSLSPSQLSNLSTMLTKLTPQQQNLFAALVSTVPPNQLTAQNATALLSTLMNGLKTTPPSQTFGNLENTFSTILFLAATVKGDMTQLAVAINGGKPLTPDQMQALTSLQVISQALTTFHDNIQQATTNIVQFDTEFLQNLPPNKPALQKTVYTKGGPPNPQKASKSLKDNPWFNVNSMVLLAMVLNNIMRLMMQQHAMEGKFATQQLLMFWQEAEATAQQITAKAKMDSASLIAEGTVSLVLGVVSAAINLAGSAKAAGMTEAAKASAVMEKFKAISGIVDAISQSTQKFIESSKVLQDGTYDAQIELDRAAKDMRQKAWDAANSAFKDATDGMNSISQFLMQAEDARIRANAPAMG
jgi:hypothetical protein